MNSFIYLGLLKTLMPKKKKLKKEVKKINKPSKKIIQISIIILALVLLLLSLFLLVETGIIKNPLDRLNSKNKVYNLQDECSLIVGQLIHSIEDENDCQLKCRTNCNVRGETYLYEEFIKSENNCHTCTCSCRYNG